MLDLLVVVVTHEAASKLPVCVASVRERLGDLDAAITVVDSGSRDDIAEVAGRLDVPLIRCSNVGFGAGANVGWRQAGAARYLLVLNPDVRVVGGSLEDAVRLADMHPEWGVLAPGVVDRRGRPVASVSEFESSWSRLGAQLRGRHVDWRWTAVRRPSRPRAFGWAVGCALLVRGECMDEVGGFDERFFLYAEERDLQLRTARAGWSHMTCPELVVEHESGGRTPHPLLFAQRFRADLHFARKWEGRPGEAATRIALSALLARRAVRGELRGPWGPSYMAALRAVITERVPVDATTARRDQQRRTLRG